MKSLLRISLSLALLLCATSLRAQYLPADDFFNGGAQLYISNNIPAALERTEAGLKIYPGDGKLQKLEKLLKQQQQSQQNQQNQQQQQQQQQNQSQQSKSDQQKNQQNQQNQQQQNSEQQKQDQQNQNKPDQQKKEDQQKQQQNSSADQQQKKDQPQSGEPAKLGEMSPEEAKRLLDAQKDNEQLLKWQPPDKPRDPNRPVKDW